MVCRYVLRTHRIVCKYVLRTHSPTNKKSSTSL
nr:MAG TPA_asm: hypothetical protein [Caudoviricetes sp.]